MTSSFKDIQFGFASAEVESSEAPQLLTEAFLDSHDVVREAISGRKFLFLGFKGSGKSAIGLHLSLIAKRRPNLFVTHLSLGDLSFQMLAGLANDEAESELRYLRAWSWLLLLSLLGSVNQDEGVVPANPSSFGKAVDMLRREGLLPVNDLADVVGKTSLKNLQISAWGIDLSANTDNVSQRLSLSVITNMLKEIFSTTQTESHHLLVIDGLDDVLLDADFQLEALSALVLEASRLNQFFRERGAPFKIIILCRTDIYERLPGSNQNKIRQDLAFEIEWFEEAADPNNANLVKLVNLRAQFSDRRINNVFASFFPSRLKRSNAIMFLLEHTRHTPRDVIQLLKYIQRASEASGGILEFRQINAGLRAYSEKYFLPEIRDELDGVVSRGETDAFMETLRQFHQSEFTEAELSSFVKNSNVGSDIDLDRILKALYKCSAIGSLYVSPLGQRRFSFCYRNPGSSYNRSDLIVVHKGLRRALQLS